MKEAKIFLSRIDIAAMLVTLLGVGLFIAVMAMRAVADFAGLISNFWSNHHQRWLVVILGLAVLWILARWKQISRN